MIRGGGGSARTRLPTPRRVEEQHWRQIKLTRQVADDLERSLPVVVEEPAIGAQRAKLQRITAPMIGPAALGDLGGALGAALLVHQPGAKDSRGN